MDSAAVMNIAAQALFETAKLCAPIVLTALVVGFAVSLLQSVTQIQEVTLSFVPKAVAVAIALLVSGSWMISEIVTFTQHLIGQIPELIGQGTMLIGG
ncbi:MAG TPA: flagellar biosynthesis protein FliQ [Microbacteriaceae bacterium]|nr:flagellar biosynthesis protein FliQ [Microbacteriaceae bacterium]